MTVASGTEYTGKFRNSGHVLYLYDFAVTYIGQSYDNPDVSDMKLLLNKSGVLTDEHQRIFLAPR